VVGAAIDVAARGYPVHVNLSVRSLDRELLALICTKLADTGARASDVTFELSERQLVDAGKEELEFVKVVSAWAASSRSINSSRAVTAMGCSGAYRSPT